MSTATASRTETEEPTEIPEEWDIDPIEHDKLVGAHYYPWYKVGTRNDWLEIAEDEPVLGEYSSADKDVSNQHIKWAREHGINWFNVSWRPRNFREHTLENYVLEAELADLIDYSLLYEEIGSVTGPNPDPEEYSLQPDESGDGGYLIDFDRRDNQKTLQRHFQRMEDRYFDDPNYVRIDGRPIVYVYSAHKVTGAVKEAWAEAKDAIDSDPYLVAETLDRGLGWLRQEKDWLAEFDAGGEYGIYSVEVGENSGYGRYLDYAEQKTTEWGLTAEHIGLDFVPEVMPGAVFSNIPDAPDRYKDAPIHRDADGFRELCRILRQRMDPDLDAILVNTFNEWPEHTAVEPSKSYGTTYLEIIEDELARSNHDTWNTEAYLGFQIRYDRTMPSPGEPDAEFGMMLDKIRLRDANGQLIASYDIGIPEDEPYFLGGVVSRPKETTDKDDLYDYWRWLGGPAGQTTVYFPPADADAATADLDGRAPPFADEPVGADIFVDGQQTDRIEMSPEPDTHTVSLSV